MRVRVRALMSSVCMCACVCDRSDVECVLCVFQGDVVGQRSVFRPHSVSGQFLLRQRVHAGSGSAAHAALSGLVPAGSRTASWPPGSPYRWYAARSASWDTA